MLKQCAWCGRMLDAQNNAYGESMPLLREASHGICAECKAKEYAKLEPRRVRAA